MFYLCSHYKGPTDKICRLLPRPVRHGRNSHMTGEGAGLHGFTLGSGEVHSTPLVGNFRAASTFVGPQSRGFEPWCLSPSLPASPCFRMVRQSPAILPLSTPHPSTTLWLSTHGPLVPKPPISSCPPGCPLPIRSHTFLVTPWCTPPSCIRPAPTTRLIPAY